MANLALAAEQLGGMRACLAMTTEYAKIAIAFGQPIGAFQGVKHRLADARTAWELAHAALRDAAREHDAHLYYKNAISQQALFSGPGEQLDRLRAMLG